MSIAVEIADLERLVGALGWAYVVSSGRERPQVVALAVTWHDGELLIADVGRGTLGNVTDRPRVTLVWPPLGPLASNVDGVLAGYSLIVDGEAAVTQRAKQTAIRVKPVSAVWHRPAPDVG